MMVSAARCTEPPAEGDYCNEETSPRSWFSDGGIPGLDRVWAESSTQTDQEERRDSDKAEAAAH
ncbi:hypothetical protein Acsp02_86380 [Actinoplanes sp. NBRC 103695]|nr:hypothetical protein Acsp02_86380 [Actinoplanes sp. NBRC 103695]